VGDFHSRPKVGYRRQEFWGTYSSTPYAKRFVGVDREVLMFERCVWLTNLRTGICKRVF
jgi:hypothetical protein